MRSPVPLPADAQDTLSELTLARDSSLDQARSAASRLQALPQDADARMRSRLSDEQAKHNARHTQLARLISSVNQFRMELPAGVVLEPAEPISVEPLRKGETLSDAVERLRGEIAAIKQNLQATRSAGLPLSDQKQLVAQAVAERAASGRPSVSVLKDQLSIAFRENIPVMSLLCWIMPDAMIEKLSAELREAPGSMPQSERVRKVAELEALLLQCERQEESLITQAADAGLLLLRRVDASPLAVLNVAFATTGKGSVNVHSTSA